MKEVPVDYIVIHDDQDGTTHYRQFGDSQDAAAHLETLHDDDRIDGARLFELHEVEFSVRSYVKVEIGGVESGDSEEPAPEAAPVPAPEYVSMDDVEYVEATMLPSDGADPADPADPKPVEAAGGEPRRGLFGR